MRLITYISLAVLSILLSSCKTKIEYVTPDWVRMIAPDDGGSIKIDYFKPDEKQIFTWEARKGATYKVYFDLNMHFENPVVYDVGDADTLMIANSDLLKVLTEIDPGFHGSQRFFWKVEQKMNDQTKSSWRYFSAMPLVEEFTDSRDGEKYSASQYIMSDGSLITIMAENLRAETYSDGTELYYGAKEYIGTGSFSEDQAYLNKIGRFYAWTDAIRGTWDEAKEAYDNDTYIQGICPDGWHMPTMKEWQSLISYFGDKGANSVKDPSYWVTKTDITNSSKLNVMISGYYWHEGSPKVTDPDWFAGFWTATPRLAGMQFAFGDSAKEDDNTKAVVVTMYDNSPTITLQSYKIVSMQENRFYPIRCIMDPM